LVLPLQIVTLAEERPSFAGAHEDVFRWRIRWSF